MEWFQWTHPIYHFCTENRKYFSRSSPFVSWHGAMISSQWLELPIFRINIHGFKDVRAIEVLLYKYWDSLTSYHTCHNIWTSIQLPVDIPKTAGWQSSSVDPDHVPRPAASDLCLHVLFRHVHPITYCKQGIPYGAFNLVFCFSLLQKPNKSNLPIPWSL